MSNPQHISWLVDTGQRLPSLHGPVIEVWELRHQPDDAIITEWANHFRCHYCDDDMLKALVAGTGKTKRQFLEEIKFPDKSAAPGPSVRAGDFAEILVADFIEYHLGYWCPRELRYDGKFNRNESSKGCDVLGFKFKSQGQVTPNDELYIFEAKAKLTGGPTNRLQDAIDDSCKDIIREAMSLSAIKQKLLERTRVDEAKAVERFQDIKSRPFRRINGAAAVVTDTVFNNALISLSDASAHPNLANLNLIVIRGTDLMLLVTTLYEAAANAA
jgi:hypothetical protein